MQFVPSSLVVWLLQVISVQGAANSEVVCGQPVNSPRIVGGQAAADGSWPWHVTILRDGYFICGASLIANVWVLSAAHCFFGHTTSLYLVLLGTYRLFHLTSNVTFSRVQKIILHPDYNGHIGSIGDIALLKLQTPVEFAGDILPICLPGASVEFPPDTDCWITGWGSIKGGVPSYPQVLQELKVPLISQKACNEIFNNASSKDMDMDPIKAGMICAGFPEGGKDSCQGDSGGPLVCKLGESWTQAGIVSFGVGCARPSYPGVYTSVPYYAKWIDYIMASGGGEQSGDAGGQSDGQSGDGGGQSGGQSGDGGGQSGGESGDGGGQSGGQSGDGGGQSGGQSGDGGGQSGGQSGDGGGQSGGQSGDGGGQSGGESGDGSGQSGGQSGDGSGQSGGQSGDAGGQSGGQSGNGGGQSGGQSGDGGGRNSGLQASPTRTFLLVSLALALHSSAIFL